MPYPENSFIDLDGLHIGAIASLDPENPIRGRLVRATRIECARVHRTIVGQGKDQAGG